MIGTIDKATLRRQRLEELRREQAARRKDPAYMALHSHSGTGDCHFTTITLDQVENLESYHYKLTAAGWSLVAPAWLVELRRVVEAQTRQQPRATLTA